MPFDFDRRAFIASLGGTAAVSLMSHEARADALEDHSIQALDEAVAEAQGGAPERFPTAAEVAAQDEGQPPGAAILFAAASPTSCRRCPRGRPCSTSSVCVSSRQPRFRAPP
jgi:hypothetical protein